MSFREDCAFELSYIKKEHDLSNGGLIAEKRIEIGEELSKTSPVEADYVVPIPETAIFYAQGYSLGSKIPLVHAVFKNRPKPKTLFVEDRRKMIREVFSVIPRFIQKKKIILVDETVISGLSLSLVIEKIKEFQPAEVHLRLANPPMTRKCPSSSFGDEWDYDGVKLLGNEIITSVAYLSIDQVERHAKCSFCFGNQYDNSKLVRY